MKYAILFAFAAFAFLAQAEAETEINGLPDIHERGAITDHLKAKLAAAKQKLEEMLSKAQHALKEKIDAAKEKAERLIELLKQKADKISDKVFEAADKILNKLESSVAGLVPEKSHNIKSISECMIIKDNFRQAVLSVIANTSSCINDKIVKAESYVTDIYNFTAGAVGAIQEVKDQGIKCIREVKGIKEIVDSIRCVARASAKGTVVVGKTVPAVLPKVAKLIKEIVTIQGSLALCMPVKALITLGQQVESVVVGIKDCIRENIEQSETPTESTESYEEVFQTEHSIEEESHNEVPVEEKSEVMANFGYEAPAKSGPITVHM